MSDDEIFELRYAIKRHIICAYLWFEFYLYFDRGLELFAADESRYDTPILFEEWVSIIYITIKDLEPLSDGPADIWYAATGRPIHDIARKAGITWDSRDDIGTDGAIVTHYFSAGIRLRYTEARLFQQ